MDKGEALALIRQGADAWNKHFAELEKKHLKLVGTGKPTEAQERAWDASSSVDLSGEEFSEPIDFSGFLFLGQITFSGTVFRAAVSFRNAIFRAISRFDDAEFISLADFGGAEFEERPNFSGTQFKLSTFTSTIFKDGCNFTDAKFKGDVDFTRAAFEDDAFFESADFFSDSGFRKAEFSGAAVFSGTDFLQKADFKGTRFVDGAAFVDSTFEGSVSFEHSWFEGPTTFKGAYFGSNPDFTAMRSESTFDLTKAKFALLPNFAQAHFDAAPYFQNVTIPNLSESGDELDHLRWRSLRRLAAEGLDHEREQMFFANELRALRRDLPVANHLGWWVFGYLYQATSNFGRSVFLPIIWLGTLTVIFAAIYGFGASYAHGPSSRQSVHCINGYASPWDAVALSVSRGVVISGLTNAEAVKSTMACLFPAQPSDLEGAILTPQALENPTSAAPHWVLYLGYLQSALSASLIFLLALAIRNTFRMR